MAGHSIPIDLRVDSSRIANKAQRNELLHQLCLLLEPYSGKLTKVAELSLPGENYQTVFSGRENMSFSVKLYANGLVSGVLEHYTEEVHHQIISVDASLRLEEDILKKCAATAAKVLPAIKRCLPVNVYYSTSDDRLLEYDVDRTVFSERSPFQKVEVVHTKSFGNLLLLDNLQNLAESDLPYTHGLMNKGVDVYKDKTVLILGGGDGALLHELLKEDPKHVLMIDIDETVIKACRKYMRSACGTVMDDYKGPNYQTVIGDAFVHLKNFIEEGRQFDYVFADLTDVPITCEPVGDVWDFLGAVIDMGLKVLKPGTGRYMTHATGLQSEGALKMFEEKLSTAEVAVTNVTRTNHFVPSFMEYWCFFQATRAALS